MSPKFYPEDINSSRPGKSGCCDSFPSSLGARHSLTPPFTPSNSLANLQMVSSPSPLSQVPSLLYPEFSPPSQESGSTPFGRQFTANFAQEWKTPDTEASPVARTGSYLPHGLSPVLSTHGGTTSRITQQSSRAAHGIEQRVSLIDKFISAAANDSTTSDILTAFPTSDPQERSLSPFSDLSDLTSLSSPEPCNRYGRGSGLRSTPPTSPTTGIPVHQRKSNTLYNGQANSNSRREVSSAPSTQGSSRPSYLKHQFVSSGLGHKRENTGDTDKPSPHSHKHKKACVVSAQEPTSTDGDSSSGVPTRRHLPTNIPYHPQFPLFYLRFPVSSYLRSLLPKPYPKNPGGIYNQPRDALDLYTPRFVKGCGTTKVGLCPICVESPSRGGKGEKVWLSMKFSAYKWFCHIYSSPEQLTSNISYHLQYGHGISSISGRPFSPPTAFRSTERPDPGKNERTKILEGKCHKCRKWIPVESFKNIEVKVKELYWWKHAAMCHQGKHIPGEDDFFRDDAIYRQVQNGH
ncbi:hypothetical protein BU15DRAFT_72453 [Melanogaster broomeanus]|nr:hypothetical protein BU15DRAFT_72453 [Melanogaster broomeanus]